MGCFFFYWLSGRPYSVRSCLSLIEVTRFNYARGSKRKIPAIYCTDASLYVLHTLSAIDRYIKFNSLQFTILSTTSVGSEYGRMGFNPAIEIITPPFLFYYNFVRNILPYEFVLASKNSFAWATLKFLFFLVLVWTHSFWCGILQLHFAYRHPLAPMTSV